MKIRTQFIKVEALPVSRPEVGVVDRGMSAVAMPNSSLATDEMFVRDNALRERRDLFLSMMQRMGINTLMVSIPTIARALGYSPATLYGYISRGTFFLPHRVVNGSPMVAIDDLVDWLTNRTFDTQTENCMGINAKKRTPTIDGVRNHETMVRKALLRVSKAA
jgi:predicted DNA-binding transcriptional regulator AlpA